MQVTLRRGTLARVILAMMMLSYLAAAGWWGGSEDEDSGRGRGRARRRRQEEQYEETVEEYDPNDDSIYEDDPAENDYRGRSGR